MIKYFLIILLFLTQFSFAQTRPTGFPTQLNTGWQRWGYSQSDSGSIIAKRDTNWLPRFNGTIVFRPQNIRPYFYDSTALRWYKLFSEPDTLTTLATQYDLTQLSFPNSNIGSGYRWAVPNTNNIKTVFASNTILWDSTSNSNALTAKADTSVLATQYDLLTRINSSNLDSVLSLGGRLSANRSVSMAHRKWDLDSAVMRLRGVDSVAISIDLAKAGDIIRFNKPEGVARTYPGSTPFKFIMENTTDDEPTERNNTVKWGWNVNRADSTNAPGIWYSMEPNYRPGGARWLENHLEVSLPNGTLHNSRLFSSTFMRGAGDSIESSQNTWDFRGTTWNFMNLTSTIGYVGMGAGSLNVNNSTAGSTDFSISNGLDVGHFNLAPGTQILDYSGTGFRITGNLNSYIANNSSSEREGIRFVGDAGTTGYIIKYNSAWGAQPDLQNAMVMTAANGTPLNTALALKNDGTAWVGDITAYTTGSQKVNLNGSLALRGLPVATTAAYILGKSTDSSVVELTPSSLATLLGVGNTLYTGDGTLAGNRSVNANNLNLTFDDVQTFRVNYDAFVQAKANATFAYTNTIVAPAQQLWMGYTPTAGTYSKGSAIVIDTNNNVALGTSTPPATAPLYADGAAYLHGLQSGRGNFYRVSDFSADHTMTNTEYWANIDASGGNVTITLPAASTVFGSNMGIQYVFKRTDASANTVTVQRNATPGTDLIDGAASFTIVGQYTVKEVQCVSTSTFAIR